MKTWPCWCGILATTRPHWKSGTPTPTSTCSRRTSCTASCTRSATSTCWSRARCGRCGSSSRATSPSASARTRPPRASSGWRCFYHIVLMWISLNMCPPCV